jgi:hypothetical protein
LIQAADAALYEAKRAGRAQLAQGSLDTFFQRRLQDVPLP